MTITYEGATEQVRRIVHHHAVLRRGVERCPVPAAAGDTTRLPGKEILPHAKAEERTFYRAAATQACGSDLVRALTAEHHALAYLAGRLAPGTDGHTAATVSEWIATLFAGHVAKENDLLLPALAGCGADLAALLADMHEPQAG